MIMHRILKEHKLQKYNYYTNEYRIFQNIVDINLI